MSVQTSAAKAMTIATAPTTLPAINPPFEEDFVIAEDEDEDEFDEPVDCGAEDVVEVDLEVVELLALLLVVLLEVLLELIGCVVESFDSGSSWFAAVFGLKVPDSATFR